MTAVYETQQPEVAPDLSIRARPPSPRRLSRKVLVAGAVIAASIVTLALFIGLSERPEREVRQAEAQAAAGGPPESIRNASGQYEAGDLPRAELDAPRDMLWGENGPPQAAALQPPEEEAWSGSPRGGAAASARERCPIRRRWRARRRSSLAARDRATASAAPMRGSASRCAPHAAALAL
ncbi:MAG: hypothetical protein IPL62_19330 [Caulobacteraceae bacterium]|nr:hypothetical protein [Caulobacteraceae bacterium]